MRPAVIHPDDYRVNQTWLIFKVNEVPIRTMEDGDFDCLVLMDAASACIVAQVMVPVTEAEPSLLECKQMFKQGKARKNQLPRELIIPQELQADVLAREAVRQGMKVVRLPETQLQVYTSEARDGFREHFGGA
ncbi:MAG: hypothetical protein HYV17_14905 [Xanthomonadales bacterium]|nr:hypothetical protein [Xanthomonadales bacterium]